jgi:hypothetical protein
LTTFYKREEQAQRISYLFVSAALSGGFGGLCVKPSLGYRNLFTAHANKDYSLAFGLIRLDGASGLEGWRWLFIVEGLMSAVVGIATFFLLPNNYETAYFLNEEDKELMRMRMQQNARYADSEEFDIKEVWKTLRDPKSWLTSFNQICVNTCSFGFSTFLPTIIRGFGYDSVRTQLLTVPVYIWASAFYLVVANLSDRVRMRAVFMVPLCLVTAVGYALMLGVDVHARGPLYFATYVCVTGYGHSIALRLHGGITADLSFRIYAVVGLGVSWNANSHSGYYKRAMAVGLQQSIGNCAGLIVRQLKFVP